MCGSNVKIEEYTSGQRLKIAYWCVSGSQQSLSIGQQAKGTFYDETLKCVVTRLLP